MKDESTPVSPDEVVIRLIWGKFIKLNRPVPVSEQAFQPRADETDGISVFRMACLNVPGDALTVIAPEKRDKYVLAMLPVAEILALGLTVVPAKVDAVPGHAVLPELNVLTLTSDGARGKDWRKRLAVIASRNVIPPITDTKT